MKKNVLKSTISKAFASAMLVMTAFATNVNAQTAPNLGKAANFGMLAGQNAQSSANTN